MKTEVFCFFALRACYSQAVARIVTKSCEESLGKAIMFYVIQVGASLGAGEVGPNRGI